MNEALPPRRTAASERIIKCAEQRSPVSRLYKVQGLEKVQSISDIRPAFLDNQNGPYKQYGPISGNTLEEGPGEEVKGLISMEM